MSAKYIWATCWYDPEDGYRKHTLALLDEGTALVIGAPLLDCYREGLTSLKEAQRHLLYSRDSVQHGHAEVRRFDDVA